MSQKVDAVCHDVLCSYHEGGCSVPAVPAVPPSLSENVDAVVLQWMQCPTRRMQYVMTDEAVLNKVDAVSLQ